MEDDRRCLIVLRLRGNVGVSKEIEETFRLIHLTRKNHATVMKSRKELVGMVKKIKDYATWGEADLDTISLLIKKRSFLQGKKDLSDNIIDLRYNSLDEIAKDIYECKVNFWDLPKIRPFFGLRPPKHGFKGSIKKPYPEGELGYRGSGINKLIQRMV